MSRSEIFDNYAKIAEELGLISTAYPNNDESTKALEKNPRWGSDDLSAIEILYGIKPNGKEDDTSIIEKAHPDTVVLSESYDRMNGVVENEIQRHNIMTDIALRPADGNLTGKRYVHAKAQLLESLVKVGFLMDSQNKLELMKLADDCAENLVKEADLTDWINEIGKAVPGIVGGVGAGFLANKLLPLLGFGPWGVAGAVALSSIPILMAIFNNIRPSSQGVLNNAKNALTQIKEAEGTVPKVKSLLASTTSWLEEFIPVAEQYMEIDASNLDHDALDVVGVAKIQGNKDEMQKLQLTKLYVEKCKQLRFLISPVITKLKSAEEDRKQSDLPKGLDYVANMFGSSVFPPAVRDAKLALETLNDSLDVVINKATEGHQEAQGTVDKLTEEAQQLKEKLMPSSKVAPKEEAPQSAPQSKSTEESTENPMEDFLKQLNDNLAR